MKHPGRHIAAIVVSILALAATSQSAEREVFRRSGMLRAVGGQVVRSSTPEELRVLFVVSAGKRVKKGDLLVELDAAPLREEVSEQRVVAEEAKLEVQLAEMSLVAAQEESDAEIELAERELEVAKLELEAYVAGEYPMEKSEAQNAFRIARQRLTHWRDQLAAWKESEDAAAEDVSEAQLAVYEAENELELAENRLGLIELMHPLQKAQRELAVSEREFSLMRMRNDRQRTALERRGGLTLAKERYLRLRERLEFLKKWVTDCRLYAPRDGLVLHGDPDRRHRADQPVLEPGGRVGGGTVLVEVVDPDRFAIEMVIARRAARRIEPVNEAVVRVDALPDERFEGRVTEVRPVADRGDVSVVTVQLEDPEGRLRIGMSAQVEIAF